MQLLDRLEGRLNKARTTESLLYLKLDSLYSSNNILISYVLVQQISSASNCTDYQSRRLGIRYRPESSSSSSPKKGKNATPTQFVHTLNATACAVPRMIVSLLENFQQEDGSVIIPEPLRPFMGGLQIIKPKHIQNWNWKLFWY